MEITQFHQVSESAPPVPDSALPAYKYAKALVNSARSSASPKTSTFKAKWDRFQGRNHWDAPKTMAAKRIDEWSFKGVCNWTYSSIKTKTAMITGATPEIFIEPIGDSTYLQRLQWKAAIEHLLESVRFDQVKKDAYISGAVTGVGIVMWQVRPDPLTDQDRLYLTPIKSEEFYCDPSADSINSPNCRFVVWEPELDMSTIRQMWPGKADQVKVEPKQITGGYTYSSKGDENLIYGNAGEFYVDQQNTLCARKARVCFVWIVDESLTKDVEKVLVKQGGQGYACVSCGEVFRPGEHDGGNCPTCQGFVGDVEIPNEYQENIVMEKQYPYGRLIIYSGDTLLYDGPNIYDIEGVFPFAVYHHDRIPGSFYGQNDVDSMSSLQTAENTVLSMGVDGVVLGMFGPFEYPVGAKAYTSMGNGPKQGYPVPDHLAGKARSIPMSGADTNLWNAVLQSIERQFQIHTGLISPMTNPGSAPISATEAEITNSRLSDRMKGESEEFSRFCTDVANIGKQLAKQFYTNPVEVAAQFPDSVVRTMEVEISSLPDVNVRIKMEHAASIRDKQIGQNVAMGLQNGMLDGPNAKIFLESVGVPAGRIREIVEEKALAQEIGPPAPAPLPPQGGMDAELLPQ